MRYLHKEEVLELHKSIIDQTGGHHGLRDEGALESARAQPHMTFDGQELYPTLAEKASASGFSMITNHPFLDGNKRIGHAVMEVFLVINGYEIDASIDEQEDIILGVAAGEMSRHAFTKWVKTHIVLYPRYW